MNSSPAPPRVMVPVTPAANWMTSALPAKVIASRNVQSESQTPIGPSEVLVTVHVAPTAMAGTKAMANQATIGRISLARNFPCLWFVQFNQSVWATTRQKLVSSHPLQERFPPGPIVRVPVDRGIEAVLEIVE